MQCAPQAVLLRLKDKCEIEEYIRQPVKLKSHDGKHETMVRIIIFSIRK